jgi:hypothetical protein
LQNTKIYENIIANVYIVTKRGVCIMVIKKKLVVLSLLLSCMSVQTTYSMDNKYKVIGCVLGLGGAACLSKAVESGMTGFAIRKADSTMKIDTTIVNSNRCYRKSLAWGSVGLGCAFLGVYLYSKSKSGV